MREVVDEGFSLLDGGDFRVLDINGQPLWTVPADQIVAAAREMLGAAQRAGDPELELLARRLARPIRRAAQWAAINRMMTNDTPGDPSDDFLAILGSVPSGATAGRCSTSRCSAHGRTSART